MIDERKGTILPRQRGHLTVAPRLAEPETDGIGADYSDVFLECRVDRHRWKLIGFYHADGAIVRSSMCDRCGCDRRQRWSAGGTILGNSYDYPDGYRIAGGVSPWEVRTEVMSRVTIYDSPDAMHQALVGRRKKSAG